MGHVSKRPKTPHVAQLYILIYMIPEQIWHMLKEIIDYITYMDEILTAIMNFILLTERTTCYTFYIRTTRKNKDNKTKIYENVESKPSKN
jgi:hypothetical protein